MAEVICFLSGKGGVGKTTVSLNLATALQTMNYPCVLVEGNYTSPTASVYLGYLPVDKTINNVLRGEMKLEEILMTHESGVNIVTSSLNISDLHDDFSGMKQIIEELKKMFSVVVVDGPAGLSTEAELVVDVADSVIIVTNPEIPAVIDALRSIKFARGRGKKVLGVVLDRVVPEKNQLSSSEVELILEMPVISSIPEDRDIARSVIYNEPVVKYKPNSKASNSLFRLAASLVGDEPPNKNVSVVQQVKNFLSLLTKYPKKTIPRKLDVSKLK